MKKTALIAAAGLLIFAGLAGIWSVLRQPARPEPAGPASASGAADSRVPAKPGERRRLPETIREDVRRLATAGSDAFPGERLRLVHALPDDLAPEDREALIGYLLYGPDSEIDHVIKNDLMNKLRNQRRLPPELTGALIRLYRDPAQNIVVRAYAIQHMRPQYQLTRDPALREVFYEALDETGNELSGSALLALRYLVQNFPNDFDHNLIAGKAMAIAADPECYPVNRISALQVATLLKHPGAVDTARQLAAEPATRLTLRLSALATLGELGDAGDLNLLDQLEENGGLLRQGALQARARIVSR